MARCFDLDIELPPASETLGTCIFTYDGQVHVGFKVDAGVIPRPEDLLAAFTTELDLLCRLGAPA